MSALYLSIKLVNEEDDTDVFATWTATPTLYGWIVVVPRAAAASLVTPSRSLDFFDCECASCSDGFSGTSALVDVTLIVYTTPPP